MAPKSRSSGKAEKYVVRPLMSQLRGLAYSSVVVENVSCMAVNREVGRAQWFRRLSLCPWGLIVVDRGW